MFYCGFDPGFETYLASHTATAEQPEPAHIWAATGLLAATILGLITLGLI